MIKVLNAGFVRLVSYMQPADHDKWQQSLDDYDSAPSWTGDLEIVRNARVSYDADWRTGEDEGKDEKLIGYMYRNHHSSPFEAMVFTFEVKAPIFVLRQWHRHRTWSYNEVSARYTKLEEDFFIPEALYVQSKDNKQMSGEERVASEATHLWEMQNDYENAYTTYETLLNAGVSREVARSVLPVGIYSRMFATVDLHNLFHFLRLRLHPHAQPEIRAYAEALLALIEPIVPTAVKAFKDEMESKEKAAS